MINIQVVYALPENPTIIDCTVTDDSSVKQAIIQSNILLQHHLSLDEHQVSIYGKAAALTDSVKAGDRIEICRPLLNDPKEIRRRRSIEQKNKVKQADESK